MKDYEYVIIDRDEFLKAVKLLSGQQNRIFGYMMYNSDLLDGHILWFNGTYDDISKELTVSRPTISKALKYLQELGLIKSYKRNTWLINPDIAFYDEDDAKYFPEDEEQV